MHISRKTGEGTWSTEEVYASSDFTSASDTAGNTTTRDALVTHIDLEIQDGVEHMAFYDAATQTLEYIEGTTGSYTQTTVDSSDNVGQWPSLLVQGGEVHIAYHDVANGSLMLAKGSAAGFSTESIDSGDFRGADTEIFSVDDVLHIVYFDGFENDMRLAKNEAGWTNSKLGGDDAAVGFHNEVAWANNKWWAASYDYTNRQPFFTQL
jgi:hypothetical protein